MIMLSVLANEEVLRPLIMPAAVFGIIALGIFFILGVAMFSYRDVAHRHAHKSGDSEHGNSHH